MNVAATIATVILLLLGCKLFNATHKNWSYKNYNREEIVHKMDSLIVAKMNEQ